MSDPIRHDWPGLRLMARSASMRTMRARTSSSEHVCRTRTPDDAATPSRSAATRAASAQARHDRRRSAQAEHVGAAAAQTGKQHFCRSARHPTTPTF